MFKRSFFVLCSVLSVLILLTGCTEEPIETSTGEKIEQEVKEKPTKQSIPNEERSHHSSEENSKLESLSELKVHYIDVGQADSTLLQYSSEDENYTILIDAGNWNDNSVVSYLNSQNVSQIDIAMGTHPDADHIGQLDKVLDTFEVGEVWMSGNTSTSQTFQRLLTAIDSKDIDYLEPRLGDEFKIGPLQIDVLYPKTISENDNEESISLKLTFGDVRFIFTGDASQEDELNMVQSGVDLQADILQLGHHGSSTSTHPTFLKKVNPSIAIYSAGKDNSYGHPHDEVVNLIQNFGTKLYGTDVHGTVVVTTDGKNYNILTKDTGTITPTGNTVTSNNKPKQNTQSKTPPSNGNCVDINSAPLEDLESIIHIGEARAEELINLRPYSSIDELSKIKGIGPARIDDIKSQGIACIGD